MPIHWKPSAAAPAVWVQAPPLQSAAPQAQVMVLGWDAGKKITRLGHKLDIVEKLPKKWSETTIWSNYTSRGQLVLIHSHTAGQIYHCTVSMSHIYSPIIYSIYIIIIYIYIIYIIYIYQYLYQYLKQIFPSYVTSHDPTPC